ncbi:MAG: SET domain-containing protein-lysine N-methyltransferase [bacterium]
MEDLVFVGKSDVGRGVFARRDLESGDVAFVFRGKGYSRQHRIHGTPLGAYLLQVGDGKYILPVSPGRYVNHSCEPNVGLVDERTLVMLAPVAAGTELRFDYSTSMNEDFWTMACACGKPTCRGLVEDFKRLPATLQQYYLELGVVPEFVRRGASSFEVIVSPRRSRRTAAR